jgi:TatD DNase family protein
MWFDSHCHLDAEEFSKDLSLVIARAAEQGVAGILVPTVDVKSFDHVIAIVERWSSLIPYLCFTLGIHPLYTPAAKEDDLKILLEYIQKYHQHPRFVGIGEIGLDYFVADLDPVKQEWFFDEQLKLAKQFDLPVILHVRKSQDQILKRLRKIGLSGGIAHAFNGSMVQASQFIALNFKLGFGGTLTYDRSLQIRRLATDLPLDSYVLETDAPDIPPAWLKDSIDQKRRNEPLEIPRIAETFATLRDLPLEQVSKINLTNLKIALPRLHQLLQDS